jgi:hypothetical protein
MSQIISSSHNVSREEIKEPSKLDFLGIQEEQDIEEASHHEQFKRKRVLSPKNPYSSKMGESYGASPKTHKNSIDKKLKLQFSGGFERAVNGFGDMVRDIS